MRPWQSHGIASPCWARNDTCVKNLCDSVVVMSEFDFIDRTGFALTPKAPFIKWLKKKLGIKEGIQSKENSLYLISPFDYDPSADAEDYLRSRYKEIFENELLSWDLEESMWPEERTYEKFREWFDIKIYETIFDMGGG